MGSLLSKKFRMEKTHHSLVSDGVDENEQFLETHKPFWVFFVGNIGLTTWLMGILIAGMGIGFSDAMFVILLGNIIGAAFPAAAAILGPKTKLSSMEASRFALGSTGKKIPAFLQWVACIGWDSVNNLVAIPALVMICKSFGLPVPFWFMLALMIGIQMLIGVYGHHVVQETSKYTGIILGGAFLIVGLIAMHKAPLTPVPDHPAQFKDLLAGLILIVTYNLAGWTTWTSDYTRYLPKTTPSKNVFWITFSSIGLSSFVLMFFGYVTVSAVTDQTPEGIMQSLQALSGHFAPLVLLLIGFSSTPMNAMNDTSGSYSLISAGIKMSRPAAAAIGAVIGYIICLLASSSFLDFFENFLSFFAHWMSIWLAIVLVHWFVIGRERLRTPSGITIGGWLLIIATMLSILLFSANTLYTGLWSAAIGGFDIGPYLGFMIVGILYYFLLTYKAKA